MTPPLPVIDADTAPRDALRLALGWLGDVVPDVEVVRSQGVLRRSRGPFSVNLRFQSSTRSRGGLGTWVGVYLTVRDRAFARWRAAHPQMTWRTGDVVHSTGHLRTDVQLFGDQPGYRALADLPAVVEGEWLPVLDPFDSPSRLAEDYDVSTTSASTCMEWAVSRDDVPSARRLLERYLERWPNLRRTLDEGRAAGPPPEAAPIRNEIRDRWGHALETLGLVVPGEPLPGVPSEVVPEPVDGMAEVRSILGAFGRVEEV